MKAGQRQRVLIKGNQLVIALREEDTKREAARVLGVRESTLYLTLRRIRDAKYDYTKRWKTQFSDSTEPGG